MTNKHDADEMFIPAGIDIDLAERSFSELALAPVPGPQSPLRPPSACSPCTMFSAGHHHLAGTPVSPGPIDSGTYSINASPSSPAEEKPARARRRRRQQQQQQKLQTRREEAQAIDIKPESSLRIDLRRVPAAYLEPDPSYLQSSAEHKPAAADKMSLSFAGGAGLASVTAYALPSLYTPSTNFALTANDVPVAVVSNVEYEHGHFSMGGEGDVELVITVFNLDSIDASDVRISPAKLNLTPEISENNVTITLPHDQYLIVKIADQPELVIIADKQETDAPSSNGTGVFNVAASPYNADSSGANLTTDSFQNAIDDASAASDGSSQSVVYVPDGVYTVGNIVLKSNVAFYLEGSAVLFFTGNPADYRVDYFKNSQGRNVTWWVSTAFNSTNVRVFGRGTLDGNGFNATTDFNFGNNILVPILTSNFAADGITVRNSGAWSVTPVRSTNVAFSNVKFLNRVLNMGENDCIDINESQDVTVTHCIGISLDDPFSTKTWTSSFDTADIAVNWPGTPMPLERVVFEDNIAWTRTFGFKVGQGVVMDQTDIAFKDGVVYDCSIGIGINHRYGNATANNILFQNIDIESVSLTLDNRSSWEAIFTEDADGYGGGPVTNVTIQDILVRDAGSTACQLSGLFNVTVGGVLFQNVTMPGADGPATTLEQLNITDVFDVEDVVVTA